jgi:signal transduction histidine kinase
VLNGEPAASIAISEADVNIKAFDWRRLEQWGIPERRLPPGSLVEFRPPSLWQEYRNALAATAAVILLQAAMIGALLVARRRRREANQELRRRSARLLTAQEDERRRVARELHDDISQRLALLAIEADTASARADGGPDRRTAGASPKLHALAADVHAIAQNLHPSRLESLGLPATLRAYCEDIGKQQRVAIACRAVEPQVEIPADIALALFRVAQEAVQNAVRHGGAGLIDVELSADGRGLVLTIADDGRGFADESAETSGGLGIAGMRERLRYVGGRLQIDSRPGAGTTVVAKVPLPRVKDIG